MKPSLSNVNLQCDKLGFIGLGLMVAMLLPTAHLVGHRTITWDTQLVVFQSLGLKCDKLRVFGSGSVGSLIEM